MLQRNLRVAALAIACLFAVRARAQNPVQWSLTVVSKGTIVPGRTFETALTATIEKGWHLYAMSQPDSGPAPTVITLARQEHPDTSLYDDPEIVGRVEKPNHVGLIVRSTGQARVKELLGQYAERFARDFSAFVPPPERRGLTL